MWTALLQSWDTSFRVNDPKKLWAFHRCLEKANARFPQMNLLKQERIVKDTDASWLAGYACQTYEPFLDVFKYVENIAYNARLLYAGPYWHVQREACD